LQQLGLAEGETSLAAMAQQLGNIAVVGAAADTAKKHVDATVATAPRRVREPLPALRPFLWLHSFSSVTRHAVAAAMEDAAAAETEPAEELQYEALDAAEPRLLALDCWRGRHFGDAVHNALEDALEGPIQRDWLGARFKALAVRPRDASDDGEALEA